MRGDLSENLRAIPYSDPDYQRVYGRRSDAESINRNIEDTLYMGRAHSDGMDAHHSDLLGFFLASNALSWLRHVRSHWELHAA